MLKKVGKVFGILLNALITIVVIATIIMGIGTFQTKILKKEHTNLFGYTMFQVITGSMSGSIEIDDIVIVKLLKEEQKEQLNVDDIVAFKVEKALVVHRIIEIREDAFVTKGDANNAKDEPISKEDVIGQVIKVIPEIGIWKKVFSTPRVYIAITMTILLFGFAFAYDVNPSKKEEKPLPKTEDKTDEK